LQENVGIELTLETEILFNWF